MSAIPSATVGVKINDWHEYINRFDAKNAEKCKAEVEKMIEEMEEDQDLLLYYQLISFRHDLMMDYLFPSDSSKKLETWEYLRKFLIHFQNGEMIEGRDFFKKAVKEAEAFENEFYMKLLNVLKALFIDTANRQNVKNALYGLKTEKGYPYFEELALVAAEFYTKKRRMEDSIYFYNEMVCAQRQIQRSDSHYEI